MMAILMVKYYLLPCIQYSERIEAARGGGVLLAVKTELLAYRRPDLEPQNSEILECDLVSPNSFKIIFCLCYSVYLQICVKPLVESALLEISMSLRLTWNMLLT